MKKIELSVVKYNNIDKINQNGFNAGEIKDITVKNVMDLHTCEDVSIIIEALETVNPYIGFNITNKGVITVLMPTVNVSRLFKYISFLEYDQ